MSLNNTLDEYTQLSTNATKRLAEAGLENLDRYLSAGSKHLKQGGTKTLPELHGFLNDILIASVESQQTLLNTTLNNLLDFKNYCESHLHNLEATSLVKSFVDKASKVSAKQ